MDLNVRAKTNKILEENVSINISDLEFGDEFLGITPKHRAKGRNRQFGQH